MSVHYDHHSSEDLEDCLTEETWFLSIANVIRPELPLKIFQINLIGLSCWEVGLERLPKEIGNLIWLQELILHGNLLTALPEEIGKLQNLSRLDLSCNRLVRLPKSIVNLELNTLSLACNKLTRLPRGLGNNTMHMDLSDNPLEILPDLGCKTAWTDQSFSCKYYRRKTVMLPLLPGKPEVAAINCSQDWPIQTLK